MAKVRFPPNFIHLAQFLSLALQEDSMWLLRPHLRQNLGSSSFFSSSISPRFMICRVEPTLLSFLFVNVFMAASASCLTIATMTHPSSGPSIAPSHSATSPNSPNSCLMLSSDRQELFMKV